MNLKEEKQRAAMFQLKVYRAAGHLAKVQKVNSFLDLGCGYPTKLIACIRPITCNVVGVDLPGKINLIPDIGFGEWIAHDFNGSKELNLRRKFDMIISADVIEHLDNPNVLLNAIKKHSTRETVILLSTPDAESTKSTEDGLPANQQHKREWKMSDFIKYLVQSGFEIIDFGCYIEDHGAYPYISDYFLCRIA